MPQGGFRNTGCFLLANALGITTALTAQVLNTVGNLDGMAAVTLFANFTYGSGGTTAKVKVQTQVDGSTWLDIAEFDFTTASATKYCELVGTAAKAVTAYAALASEGVNDNLLGNQLRAIITTTGTYAGGTALTLSASVR